MDLEQLKKDTKEILVDVLSKSRLHQGQILVLGMSSSEVAGGQIGKASNIGFIWRYKDVSISIAPWWLKENWQIKRT